VGGNNLKKKEKIFLIIFFILFIFLTMSMAFYHENWRDEVQAFLLCRDMNFLELIKNIHYEGHPFLYYLILYPLVKFGASLKIVNILALIFIYISLYIIFFKMDIKLILKISIAFSFPILYYYSIIGRSYSLIVLLITLISYFYKMRDKYPITLGVLIGLLMNTHLAVGGFCFIISVLFYLYELFINRRNNTDKYNKKLIVGLIIIIIFGVILILQFVPILFTSSGMSISKSISILGIITKIFTIYYAYTYSSLSIFIIILITIIFIYLFFYDKKMFFIYSFSILYMGILYDYIFDKVSIHLCLVSFLFLIFIINNIKVKDKLFTIIIFLIFIFTIPNSLLFYKSDYKYLYSDSEEVSKYIKNNISSDSIIYTMDDAEVSPITGYLKNYKFYHLNSRRYFTYIIWDSEREKDINLENVFTDLNNNLDKYYIAIYNDKMCLMDEELLNQLRSKYEIKKVYETSNKIIVNDEKYVIYKLNDLGEKYD
jgi:hypothetical protein